MFDQEQYAEHIKDVFEEGASGVSWESSGSRIALLEILSENNEDEGEED
jgi:hypothetical protein